MSFLKNIPAMVAGGIRQRLGGAFAPNAKLEILQLGSPATLIPEYTTAYNTAMLVEVDSAYQSWVVYNRVDATTYFSKFWGTNANRGIAFSKPAVDIYGLLDDINKFLCTDFTQDEVYNDPIITGDTVTLRFTDKCKWFTGQATLPVEVKHRTVNNKVMAKVGYTPNVWRGAVRTQAKINPGLLTFSLDYDGTSLLAIQPTLVIGDSALTTGFLSAANAATIAAFLKSKDGLPWQASATAGEFNLYNSVLLFNGNALDFNIMRMQYANIAGNPINDTLGVLLDKFRMPRLKRRYLAVLMVNGTYATNLDQDLLYIQYGPTIDVAAIDARPDPKPLHHWPLEGNYRNYGKDPKKPELAIRGTFQPIGTYDGGSWLHVHADTSTLSNNSPIGVILPVDRDFTFTFKYNHNAADTAMSAGAVQFYQLSKGAGYTAGRIGVMADNLFGIDSASYVNAVHSDTKNWPHSTVVTIVREGDEWSIYHDGILRANFRNFTVATIALDTVYCVNTRFLIKDIRYYDVALTPDQVRRAVRLDPALLGDPYVVNKVVPAPQYHFPLKGNLLDKTGTVEFITSQKGTARFNAVTYGTGTSKFYYNAYSGQILMGVGFPRDADFTFQWDMYASAAISGAYQLWLDGITNVLGLNLLNGWVRSPIYTLLGSYTPSVALPAGTPYRWTIARRGRSLYFYLNSKFIYSELVPEGTVLNPLTWIWTPAFLSGGGIKDVKYWNTALSEDQVIASLKEPF